MYIKIESELPLDRDFANNKSGAEAGARWYVREQAALMFKDDSSYPDKFNIQLAFAGTKADQQAIAPFHSGDYELTDQSFGFDSRGNPTVDFTQIRPRTEQDKTQKKTA